MNLIDIIEPLWFYLAIEEIKALAVTNKGINERFKRTDRLIKRDFGISTDLESKYNFYTLYQKAKVAHHFGPHFKRITDLAIELIYHFLPEAYWRHFLIVRDHRDILCATTVCATMEQYDCHHYSCYCTESSGTKCCRQQHCSDDCSCRTPGTKPCLSSCDCRTENRCEICRDDLGLDKCLQVKYNAGDANRYYDQYCKRNFEKFVALNPFDFNALPIDPDDENIPNREEDYPEYRLYLFNRTYINRVKMFRAMSTFDPPYLYSKDKIFQARTNLDFVWYYEENWSDHDDKDAWWSEHYDHLHDQMVAELLQ